MPSFRTGTVVAIREVRDGLQRVDVDLAGSVERAYVLTRLTGTVEEGDEVVVNTTAVELGLGTGGWHVVHWNLRRTEWSEAGPGHIMKSRYTSFQHDAGSAEAMLADPVFAVGVAAQLACQRLADRFFHTRARIGDRRCDKHLRVALAVLCF